MSNKKSNIWKRILIILSIVLIALIGVFVYPTYKIHKEMNKNHSVLTSGKENLLKLINAEDLYYQKYGKYLALHTSKVDAQKRQLLGWCVDDCSPCEFGVNTNEKMFTATAKCQGKDGIPNYLGYIRVQDGLHMGIEGVFGKCDAKGIYGGNRFLVNKLGPCVEQSNGLMWVASGSKKRLVVKTMPSNASIFINGKLLGKTDSQHNTINADYGSYFWSDPNEEPMSIKISKDGYQSVEFPIDWNAHTFTIVSILRK